MNAFIYGRWVCVTQNTPEARGQLVGVCSLSPRCGSQGLNSGDWAWRQVHSPGGHLPDLLGFSLLVVQGLEWQDSLRLLFMARIWTELRGEEQRVNVFGPFKKTIDFTHPQVHCPVPLYRP